MTFCCVVVDVVGWWKMQKLPKGFNSPQQHKTLYDDEKFVGNSRGTTMFSAF